MTYEEKVKQRAEELAKVQYDDLFSTFEILPPGTCKTFSELTDGQREMMIVRTMPCARLSVQRESEAYEMAARSWDAFRRCDLDNYFNAALNTMLQSLGLVPVK